MTMKYLFLWLFLLGFSVATFSHEVIRLYPGKAPASESWDWIQKGGHGFGFSPKGTSSDMWTQNFENWLRNLIP